MQELKFQMESFLYPDFATDLHFRSNCRKTFPMQIFRYENILNQT